MSKNWVITCCIWLLSATGASSVQAQRFFNDAYLEASGQSGFEHAPYTLKILQDNYTPITASPIPGSDMQWQLAVQHKTKDVRMYVNIMPDVVVFGDKRSAALPGINKCDFIASEDHSDLAHIYRADQMYIAWGESCSSTLGDWDHVVVFSHHHNGHLAELYFFYSDWDELDPEMSTLLECFRFTADQSTLKGRAGIGITLGYDIDTWSWQVTRVVDDSPAQHAGILPGDHLNGVNGAGFSKVDYHTVYMELTGEAGTDVEVEVIRIGRYFRYTIERTTDYLNRADIKLISEADIDYELATVCENVLVYCAGDPTVFRGAFIKEVAEFGGEKYYEWTGALLPDRTGSMRVNAFWNTIVVTSELYSGSKAEIMEKFQTLQSIFAVRLPEKGFTLNNSPVAGTPLQTSYYVPADPTVYGAISLIYQEDGGQASLSLVFEYPKQ